MIIEAGQYYESLIYSTYFNNNTGTAELSAN